MAKSNAGTACIMLILGGEGLTVSEDILLSGLRNLYGYPSVVSFSSVANAQRYSVNHEVPKFVACVITAVNREEVVDFFEQLSSAAPQSEKVLIIESDSGIVNPCVSVNDDLGQDNCLFFGEQKQGDLFFRELRQTFGIEEDSRLPPEIMVNSATTT